jgi:DNA polymerase elongation subunit (family B)
MSSSEIMKNWTQEDLETLVILKQQGLTWEKINLQFPQETANSLRKTYYRYMNKEIIVPNAPKVLLVDIETLPMEAYVWGLFDQNIGLEMVKTDWSVLSFSAKWLGAPPEEIMYSDTRDEKNVRDDLKILKIIHSLLDEADVVITQNGIRFDIPKLNARFIRHGMQPPSSFRQIDTMRIAKRHFNFTSNKLAYMTELLCTKYKKLDHSEFSGFKLWNECMKGNIKAFKSMEEYNKYDVLSLEELYTKLAPWDKTIRFSAFNEDNEERCSCGSTDIKQKGFIYTNTAMYERHVCKNCGKEYRGAKNIMTKANKQKLR